LTDGKCSALNLPESQSEKCPECERLWAVYSVATRKYLDAAFAQKDPRLVDLSLIEFLEDQAREAAQWRELARKGVRDHAATHAVQTPETLE
jgi:hypothetical protein